MTLPAYVFLFTTFCFAVLFIYEVRQFQKMHRIAKDALDRCDEFAKLCNRGLEREAQLREMIRVAAPITGLGAATFSKLNPLASVLNQSAHQGDER